jgi:hypothetical protein
MTVDGRCRLHFVSNGVPLSMSLIVKAQLSPLRCLDRSGNSP